MIEEGVEVIVTDDVDAVFRMLVVEFDQMLIHLQPHRGFSRSLGAEDDGGGRFGRVAVNLVPGRMISVLDAVLLEHGIGLRILFGEGVSEDAVVFEKSLSIHAWSFTDRLS